MTYFLKITNLQVLIEVFVLIMNFPKISKSSMNIFYKININIKK